ncbi:allantoicase [Streptomyces actinomycinicus]|uniref:Probable allantoicase n=1 Tax=Streptomyces actinomycinicus TaxID=1695166 RepID=A0A937JS95_9ACTN|nr:allantoicase [Streptomyces actinomycinicus]MBL1086547.1 allantoicase [Streptomyces actinomycinicus]
MPQLTDFTGDAQPYEGGDTYADYRKKEVGFTRFVNLADRRLGAGVVATNDDLFAEGDNLVVPQGPRFDWDTFDHKGKVMDGWETRRRRGRSTAEPHPTDTDHDWALVRLGLTGIIRGVIVDTAHFRGNYPHEVSVQATCAPYAASAEELLSDGTRWVEIVPRSPVGGHAANAFSVETEEVFTHVRLVQHPDGGVARLRVHGEVVPDVSWFDRVGSLDLVALENGAVVEDASDLFYSPPTNLIMPGRPQNTGDCWETRRRRDKDNDWVRYRLAEQGEIRAVEVDTTCLKGNAAGWAALHGFDASTGADVSDASAWFEVLPRTRLQPDTRHRFEVGTRVATHVRLDIFPDGGLARLRVHGALTEPAAERLADRRTAAGS